MGLFENFPYANFHELNLDWILHELKELETEITNFVAINSVKYANPIVWDITSQYETNTVVLDSSGNAYLSVQPVPAGVALDREEYWTKIGNFSALWDSVRSAITPYDEQHSTTASVDHKAGDWVWLENDLLLITKNITAGDKYVDGSNCKKTNVHDLFTTLGDTITNEVNTLSGELQNEVTARENGDTTLEGKIAAEVQAREEADTALKEEIKEAENVVFFEKYGAVGDGVTDDTAAIKAAIAEAENKGKWLASLAKTYFVTDTITIDCNKVKNINIAGTIKSSFTDKTIVKFYSPIKEENRAFIRCCVNGTNGFGGYNFPVDTENFEFDNIQMVGIEFNGIRKSAIFCSAINCGIGILFTTDNTGAVNNNVNIENVDSCVIGLDLHPTGNGWVNSNNFYNGDFHIDSKYSEYGSRTIAVRLKSPKYEPNNNVFIGTSFETKGLPILFDNASNNHFIDCRNENRTPYIAKFINKSTMNVVDTLYGNGIPTKLGEFAAKNIVTNVFTHWLNSSITVKRWDFDRNKCFNCGEAGSDGSRTLVFDNDIIDTRKGPVVANRNQLAINEDGLAISGYYCIGALIDTSIVKTFLFASDSNSNVNIIPCDSSGTPIRDDPKRTAFASSNPWYEESMKCYQMSPINNSYDGVVFGENTKRAFIGFSGTLSYFEIRAVPVYGELAYGSGVKVYKISPDVGSYKIPGTNIDSKCVTGTMLPACDATGTALAYICTDGAAQTWVEIKKPT